MEAKEFLELMTKCKTTRYAAVVNFDYPGFVKILDEHILRIDGIAAYKIQKPEALSHIRYEPGVWVKDKSLVDFLNRKSEELSSALLPDFLSLPLEDLGKKLLSLRIKKFNGALKNTKGMEEFFITLPPSVNFSDDADSTFALRNGAGECISDCRVIYKDDYVKPVYKFYKEYLGAFSILNKKEVTFEFFYNQYDNFNSVHVISDKLQFILGEKTCI